jgi:hypothetical protein
VKEAQRIREVLKEFYTVIKRMDEYLRFVLLMGISKFSKVGVFSGLNSLLDLTMGPVSSSNWMRVRRKPSSRLNRWSILRDISSRRRRFILSVFGLRRKNGGLAVGRLKDPHETTRIRKDNRDEIAKSERDVTKGFGAHYGCV